MNEIITSKKPKFKKLKNFELPMFHAVNCNNLEIFKLITENLSEKEVDDSLSFVRDNKETVSASMQDNLALNEDSADYLQPHEEIKQRVQNVNRFLAIRKNCFRYEPISLRFKDQDLIHPLIYMCQQLETVEDSLLCNGDMTNTCSLSTGYNFIDQLFVMGSIRYMNHKNIKPAIERYLKSSSNLKKIEKIINSDFPEMEARNDYKRVALFLQREFGVKIKLQAQKTVARAKILSQFKKVKDDYLVSSQKCLDQILEDIKKENASQINPECTVDSEHYQDTLLVVVKDEETGRYFDAYRTKIDVKKTYYGFNSYYYMQLLKDNARNLYVIMTHWGRCGDRGERQRTPFKDYNLAKKEFCKIFKSKFKYKWEEAHLFSESNRNRFIQPGLSIEINYDDIIKELDYTVPSAYDPRFEEFFKAVFDANDLLREIEKDHYNIHTCLLTPFSFEAINKGLSILSKIKAKILESDKFEAKGQFEDYCIRIEQIADLNNEYFRAVPTIHESSIELINTKYNVSEEIAKLNRLSCYSSLVRMNLAAFSKQDTLNPTDYLLGVLPQKFKILEESTDEHKLLMQILNFDLDGFFCNSILELEDSSHSAKEESEFIKTENHRMLCLKIESESILNILINGVEVYPYQIEKFDNDENLEDYFKFSDSYSIDESLKKEFCVFCEVALGNMVNINPDDDNSLFPHKDIDSYRIMASEGPNWDNFVTMNGITYPIGPKITYDQPFCRETSNLKFDSYDTFKKFINGKIEADKMHQEEGIWKLGSKAQSLDNDEDMGEGDNNEDMEEEDNQDEEIEEDEDDANRESDQDDQDENDDNQDDNQDDSSSKTNSKQNKDSQKLILIDRIKDPNAKISFPIYPNEITAVMSQTFKSKDSIDYTNYTCSYIILKRNLFRIRYIAHIKKFVKKDLDIEENEENEENEEEDDENDENDNNEDY